MLLITEAGKWVGTPCPRYCEPLRSRGGRSLKLERASCGVGEPAKGRKPAEVLEELVGGLLVGRGGGGGVAHYCRQAH